MTLIFDGIAPWIAVDTLVLAGMHITVRPSIQSQYG